ncbi:hypothetical protein RB195_016624 [Necator americanus]|uniref:Uncharacterized protein n=2 Tax=Necator americanus TaxID=51031 RepID=W2TXY4_NECAM|nr:hypothetical protein NECAME_05771 [Necator americanus]ETN86925.1 hypothetical protein NECAME_05771 [Necator americanus]
MSPKRRIEEDEEWPRRKAPIFNELEAKRLINLYVENRDRYHGKIKSSGRCGESDKQLLLKKWTKEISSMGFSNRSKEQIEEKIRNEIKKVQKYLKFKKEKCSKSGSANVPRLASYLNPLVKLLDENNAEHSISGIEESPPQQPPNTDEVELQHHVGFLFDEDMKPTREELAAILEGSMTSEGEGTPTSTVQEPLSSLMECNSKDEKRTTEEFAASIYDARSLLMDRRSLLLEAETKLAEMKQKEIAIRLEEAKISLELRKIELERAKLELDRIRGTPADRYSRAPTPPATPHPYPTQNNL